MQRRDWADRLELKHYIAIVLAFAVIAVWFSWRIYTSSIALHAKAEQTIVQLQEKRVAAFAMMRAARERTFYLLEMHITDDIFRKDELMMALSRESANFIVNREKLQHSELTDGEEYVLNQALGWVTLNVPRQVRAADLMMNGQNDEAYDLLFGEIIPTQLKVLGNLSAILSGLEETSAKELIELRRLHQQNIIQISLLVGVILIATLLAYSFFFAYAKRNERRLKRLVDERTAQLDAANNQIRSLFENSSDAVVSVDVTQQIRMFNPAAERMFGYQRPEVIGQPLDMLLPKPVRQRHHEYVDEFAEDECRHSNIMSKRPEVEGLRSSGDVFPAEISICKSEVGGALYMTAFIRDDTERREAERVVRQMAITDGLTGLRNRHYFDESLADALSYQKRHSDFSLALMLIDLDLFKQVNDQFGHPAGDELLRRVAIILKESVRDMDIVSRLGGDEFAILFKDLEHCNVVEAIATELIEKISEPQSIDGNDVLIGASIGIACFQSAPADREIIIKQADQQLYAAKEAGKNTFRSYKA